MKKILLLLVCLTIGILWADISNAQGFTPPNFTLGLTLDGNFAVNNAHGANLSSPGDSYGMVWGRGVTIFGKMGLGIRKNHRITLSAGYNKMIHNDASTIPFFTIKPDAPFTIYDIWTGALGYEYVLRARCSSRPFLGIAVTGNYIVSDNTAPTLFTQNFENSFRIGLMVSAGYEWTIDKAQKYGISVGAKYNLTNLIGTKNGANTMNDADGPGGSGYFRRIGIMSLNVGFNIYTGVKPYRAK